MTLRIVPTSYSKPYELRGIVACSGQAFVCGGKKETFALTY